MFSNAQLMRIGFKPNRPIPSVERIEHIESLIGVSLPDDYREFLLSTGGGELRAWVECSQPTPFGDHGLNCLFSVDEIIELLDSTVVPRNMISIGYGDFGATTCLSIAGLDHGHVYSLDTEMRYYWDRERLAQWTALDVTVAEFFRLRDEGRLVPKPWGYENCYHVADSFAEFVGRLKTGDP